ncbi:MAG: 4Fe-4S dicluster domain-containing protein [Desulfobacterales bacterium]|nr:4Fe-4S dicluster domain-containing protein [Desulfobacterales bacterium]
MNIGAASIRKTSKIAVIDPWCTGCGGSPICAVYCKTKALKLLQDAKNYPFNMMTVDGSLCIGCGACVSGGRQGIMLSGCPWNAIHIEHRI